MSREKVSREVEATVLLRSRRWCCICYGLSRDSAEKRGQIAHLDGNPANGRLENLAYLCLEHHDAYDSRSSQSKSLTITETKVFRSELEEAIAAALRAPLSLSPTAPDRRRDSWDGLYRLELPNSSAELEISSDEERRVSVRGIAFWGTKNPGGPNIGELRVLGRQEGDQLRIEQGEYALILHRTHDGFDARELNRESDQFGMNVTFQGHYRRVPAGADALPQAPLRTFESEFWPEEGRPVFVARVTALSLHARPTIDAPIVAMIDASLGQRVEFSGFRYRTVRPGRVVALRETQIRGRNLGQTDYISSANYYRDGGEQIVVRLKEGAEIEYLQYRAEGSGFVRWQGLILDVPYLPWLGSSDEFEMVARPVAESWLRVQHRAAGGSGWLLADGHLEETGREF